MKIWQSTIWHLTQGPELVCVLPDCEKGSTSQETENLWSQTPHTEINPTSNDESKKRNMITREMWRLDCCRTGCKGCRCTYCPGGLLRWTTGAAFVWESFLRCQGPWGLQLLHHKRPRYEWNQYDCGLDCRAPLRPEDRREGTKREGKMKQMEEEGEGNAREGRTGGEMRELRELCWK